MSNWGNDFKDKVIIVTGAASGIGKETAIKFWEEGAKVLATDVNYEKLVELAEAKENMIAMKVDMGNGEEIEDMIDRAMDEFGDIDVLVNNAGVNPFTPLVVQSEEDWDNVMNINVKGLFLAIKEVLPIFIEKSKGNIINVTSIMSMVAGFGQVPYNASKGAAKLLTQGTAVDCAEYGIRCNAVAPGMIETGLTTNMFKDDQRRAWFVEKIPRGRIGKPEDIANAILFLASDKSDYVNGTTLVVDGGMITTRG